MKRFYTFLASLLLIVSCREISKDGSRIRLANIAIIKVTATSPPRACVPPKLEDKKIENPKNKTTEV